ncbi:hypothetical protein ACFX2I_035500 [Malus domestica]
MKWLEENGAVVRGEEEGGDLAERGGEGGGEKELVKLALEVAYKEIIFLFPHRRARRRFSCRGRNDVAVQVNSTLEAHATRC